MALQGLDTAAAPGPGQAKAMLDEIGGSWWNVYIGGPRSGGSGWTPGLLREYGRHGIRRFLLLYVGRQQGDAGLLTASQGEEDGNEAFQVARAFGFSALRTPLCLDLEGQSFDASPRGSLDYACGWCRGVRAHHLRPGVYSSPAALAALAPRKERPGWVWIASWDRHRVNPRADPHHAASCTNATATSSGPTLTSSGRARCCGSRERMPGSVSACPAPGRARCRASRTGRGRRVLACSSPPRWSEAIPSRTG